jgi:hypothetical protein
LGQWYMGGVCQLTYLQSCKMDCTRHVTTTPFLCIKLKAFSCISSHKIFCHSIIIRGVITMTRTCISQKIASKWTAKLIPNHKDDTSLWFPNGLTPLLSPNAIVISYT